MNSLQWTGSDRPDGKPLDYFSRPKLTQQTWGYCRSLVKVPPAAFFSDEESLQGKKTLSTDRQLAVGHCLWLR